MKLGRVPARGRGVPEGGISTRGRIQLEEEVSTRGWGFQLEEGVLNILNIRPFG